STRRSVPIRAIASSSGCQVTGGCLAIVAASITVAPVSRRSRAHAEACAAARVTRTRRPASGRAGSTERSAITSFYRIERRDLRGALCQERLRQPSADLLGVLGCARRAIAHRPRAVLAEHHRGHPER